MSSLASIIKSENLAIVTETCRPRLPVLIYSTPFVMSQNCKKQGCRWYGVKRIKTYFREEGKFGIVEEGLGHLFITSTSSYFFNKTDFEQSLYDNEEHLQQNQLSSVYVYSEQVTK